MADAIRQQKFISIAIVIALLCILPNQVLAKDYTINYQQSEVKFGGVHDSNAFEGVFESWEGSINFDPDNLETSKILLSFDLSTAKTGNKMYDDSLPHDGWFDVKNHPSGIFESTKIKAKSENIYTVEGGLTLRGVTLPVSFDTELSDLTQSPVVAKGTLNIDRLSYGIGNKWDAKAEWVSQNITIDFMLVAE